jgi:hypothetical protein
MCDECMVEIVDKETIKECHKEGMKMVCKNNDQTSSPG